MKKRNIMIWMLSAMMLCLTFTVEGNAKTLTSEAAIANPCTPARSVHTSASTLVCNGDNNGYAEVVNVKNGVPPYTFQWDVNAGSQVTSKATGLTGGTYFVTVTDATGCLVPGAATVIQPPKIIISFTSVNETAPGALNGSADATISGGNPPLSYLWSSGEITEDIFGKAAGTYSLTVTDDNGCTQSSSVLIGQDQNTNPPAPCFAVKVTTIDASCDGFCDGAASIAPNPSGTYSYVWSTGSTLPIALGLCEGKYSVTITNTTGCSVVESVYIGEPDPLTVGLTSTETLCFDSCDGSATATAAGGTLPYSYKWGDGQSSATADDLCAGSHSVTVTDGNGCTVAGTVLVEEPTQLQVNLSTTDITCFGARDGTADLIIKGGTADYEYKYNRNGGSFSPLFAYTGPVNATKLKWGIYSVMAVDDNGCVAMATDTITEPTRLKAKIEGMGVTPCVGPMDGKATVTPSGGTKPYEYLWLKITTEDVSKLGGTTNLVTTIDTVGTTDTIFGLSGGHYKVIVTDANGCMIMKEIDLIDYPIVLKMDYDNVTCPNGQDGSAKVTVNGGKKPFKFIWSNNGSITRKNDNLAAGPYCVTVIDANGCSETACVTITEPAKFSVQLSSDTVSCYGVKDGKIRVDNVTGGKAPYTFSWDGPKQSGTPGAIVKNVAAGKYKVTVTDQNGCTYSPNTGLVVHSPPKIVWKTTAYDETCYGAKDGAIIAVPNGGTPPFIYKWSGGKQQLNVNTITSLAPGWYTVDVTDANKCQSDTSLKIYKVDSIDYNKYYGIATCSGNADGFAEVTKISGGNGPYDWKDVLAGNGPYTFQWDDPQGQTTSRATGLTTGIYHVTISDGGASSIDNLGNPINNICTNVVRFQIQQKNLNISVTTTDVDCNGEQTGEAVLTVTGGNGPFKYIWSNFGSITNTVSNLKAGNYGVTVTDVNGCSESLTFTINENPAINYVTSSVDASCYSYNDGELHVDQVTGGKSPYTFYWSGFSFGGSQPQPSGGPGMGAHHKNVSAGKYKVTVTDQLGCTVTSNIPVIVSEPGKIYFNPDVYNASCHDSKDGAINLNPKGGTPPYLYWWSGGTQMVKPSLVTSLKAGYYTVSITDANKCTTDTTIKIKDPKRIDFNIDMLKASCFGFADGEASVSKVTGGNPAPFKTPPYSYLWSDPAAQTTSTATGLAAGWYYVTVFDKGAQSVDDLGNITHVLCHTVDSIKIIQNNLQLSITGKDITCNGGQDGEATVTVTGNKGPLKYIWSNFAVPGQTISGVAAGTYTVTVIDENGCSNSISITLTEPAPMSVTTSSNPVSCYDGSDGELLITSVAGGKAPYTFDWSSGDSGPIVKGLGAGKYKVTVTDQNGCTLSPNTPTIITQPKKIKWHALKADVSCYGAHDGAAFAQALGGTPPFIYWWSGGTQISSPNLITSLAPGKYQVSVVDANKCPADTFINIEEPDTIQIDDVITTKVLCTGTSTGTGEIILKYGKPSAPKTSSAGGNGGPYSFKWDDPQGQTTSKATGLAAGFYHVTVTDKGTVKATNSGTLVATKCIQVVKVQIKQNPPLKVEVDPTDVSCHGLQDGSAKAIVINNSKGGIKYLWSNYGSTTSTLTGLAAGTYSITITDADGCAASDTFEILEPAPLSATLFTDSVSCFGLNDGTVGVSKVHGGTAPYTFQWSPNTGGATTPVVKGLQANHYSVTITDQSGCTYTDAVNLYEPANILLVGGSNPATICSPQCNGVATVAALSGGSGFTYVWDNKITGSILTAVCPGSYTVTVTNSKGCSNSLKVTVADSCKPGAGAKTISSTTVDHSSNLEVNVYPNPFSTQANLVVTSDEDMDINVELFDINGKVVQKLMDQSIESGLEYNVVIERGNLSEGVYVYRITSNGAVQDWGRLIISK
ncbi:MAG: T9SS type A sorting domain-containing protein [Chitinophagales bacterium]|nr:T9SS type A sorting domain-containing protein [Chitinophagales bacterium]